VLDFVGGEKGAKTHTPYEDDHPSSLLLSDSGVLLQLPSYLCQVALFSRPPPQTTTHWTWRNEGYRRFQVYYLLIFYNHFNADGRIRQRWNTLFHHRDTPSDLRDALKSEQEDDICTNGLRSICWKACARDGSHIGSCAYLGTGVSAFRKL
jgi:hypothetical protein